VVFAALIVIAGFIGLAGFRLAGARRGDIARAVRGGRIYAVLLALAAIVTLTRGAFALAAALGVAALLVWSFTSQRPETGPSGRDSAAPDAGDAEARALLGLGNSPTTAQIRTAFRTKMAQAHPDRGGDPALAARLTQARDRLLKKA
jgi:hypothetical protein